MTSKVIETPEIKVGVLHPCVYEEIVLSSPDSEAPSVLRYDPLGVEKKKGKELKSARHVARVLVMEGSDAAKKKFKMDTAVSGIKMGNRYMKWHSARKARAAVEAVKSIDPGIGWKIQVVRDVTANPPPIPEETKVPPINITKDPPTNDDKPLLESEATLLSHENWKVCQGCLSNKCPYKKRIAVAVNLAEGCIEMENHWRNTTMHEWFCEIYRNVIPDESIKSASCVGELTKENRNLGMECAIKFAKENWVDWFSQFEQPDSIGSIEEE